MISSSKRLTLGALAAGVLALSTGAAWAQDVVKIGYSGPLSGGAALYGKDILDGMRMAVAEINAASPEIGGKKYKFEVVGLDDKYNPSETAINAQRLTQEHKTPVILVGHSGGIYATQTTNEAQKYLILAYSSAPKITQNNNKLTVRIPPAFTDYMPTFVRYAMDKHGKTLGVALADHDYAKAWNENLKVAWVAAGGKIVAENPMSYNRATDFYSGVSRVMAAKPDVMLIGGPSEPTGLVVKQARELGFKGGFMMIDQAKMEDVSKISGGYASLEGAVGTMPLVDWGTKSTDDFVARFKAFNPSRGANSEHGLAYTAVFATLEAMKLAKTTTDAVAIRAQFDAAFKKMTPANNPYAFNGVDSAGAALVVPPVAVVENGKVRAYTIPAGK